MQAPQNKSDQRRTRARLRDARWHVAVILCATFTLSAAQPSYALPEDADKPITIRAKEMQGDQRNNRAIYTGDVQVDQGTLRVNAERMVVEVKDQKVTKITFNGKPARYQQQLNAAKEQVRARAEVIVYYTQSERLDLKGEAYLTQEGNEITGELIEYDIVAGKVDASSTPAEGPIRMILQPARDKAPTSDNDN